MSPENKLRIGFQVATAVGDMHSADGDNNNMPSISHNDLCCHQFILIDGVFKLNDFHLASTLYKDREGNACVDWPKGMNRNVRIHFGTNSTVRFLKQGGAQCTHILFHFFFS